MIQIGYIAVLMTVLCLINTACVDSKKYFHTNKAVYEDTVTLSNDSIELPENWTEKVLSADKVSSRFHRYYTEDDTIDNPGEMRRIFKTLFENDSVLKMRICGWTDLDTILHAYDISFYSGNITRSVPSDTLSNGIILNFNNHSSDSAIMNVRIRRLPNGIFWVELFHAALPFRQRISGKIILAVQIRDNDIYPLGTSLEEW